MTQATNSGVYIRTSNVKDPVQTGIEIQVADLAQGRPLDKGSLGGIYDLVPPKTNALKPDDWNRYTITCDGPRISVVLNGQLVSEANLDLWTEARKSPDGTANKFDKALKDFARSDTSDCRITAARCGTGTFASSRCPHVANTRQTIMEDDI